ncbi:hypothetical protein [Candidatus Hepatobacter penaei]|uniref:hypothetical protein n=1 Tax=Candidatus Hepatobacter penaei TaxID=1274402 RepID=UPI0004F2C03C|nr:hypothetical protein [Candidatus Hepatobacter penaei]
MHTSASSRHRLFLCLTSLFDHFDTALYGFLAPILAPLFFSYETPLMNLMATYGVLSIGVVFRPLGVMAAYRACQHWGVDAALTFSLWMMTLAMMGMSLVPTAGVWGMGAPLALICLRGVLDMSVSWERSLSKLYLLECTPQGHHLWWSALYEGCSLVGMFLAAMAVFVSQNHHVSWRWLFVAGGLLALWLALQRHTHTTAKKRHVIPAPVASRNLLYLLWQKKNPLTRIALAQGFAYGTYVMPFVFFAVTLPTLCGAMNLTWEGYTPAQLSFLYGFDFLCLLGLGWRCRHQKPHNLLWISSCVLGLSVIPLFLGMQRWTSFFVMGSALWIVFWGVLFTIALTPWITTCIPPSAERYLLVGLSKAVGSSVIGRNMITWSLIGYHLTHHIVGAGLPLAVLGLINAFQFTRHQKIFTKMKAPQKVLERSHPLR